MCVLKKFTNTRKHGLDCDCKLVTVLKKRGYEWFPGNFTECSKDAFIHDFFGQVLLVLIAEH